MESPSGSCGRRCVTMPTMKQQGRFHGTCLRRTRTKGKRQNSWRSWKANFVQIGVKGQCTRRSQRYRGRSGCLQEAGSGKGGRMLGSHMPTHGSHGRHLLRWEGETLARLLHTSGHSPWPIKSEGRSIPPSWESGDEGRGVQVCKFPN